MEKMINKKRLFVNNNEALINLFSGGIGFGTLTESIARPHIESGALIALNQSKTIEDQLALVWYPRPVKQQYFEEIIKSIK
jgi:DNA-binding transcriptional LysR family regulator